MRPSEIEKALLRLLRASAELAGVHIAGSVDATLSQMELAIAGTVNGIVVEPAGLDAGNPNLGALNSQGKWTVYVVQNGVPSVSVRHVLDLANDARRALWNKTLTNADGAKINNSSLTCGPVEVEPRLTKSGTPVRMASFSVTAYFSD